ncbi:hypothetical protein RR46_02292 [Papilio xuthus]|uniref:Uncharacterized protein n=1 Tax=Papilio xuthus TaxID=66420 RepID=A0A194QLF6_PAPXU|nr:hypothetical protein RR46_02292 [Papilio xuthus]
MHAKLLESVRMIFLMPFTFARPPLYQSLTDSFNSVKDGFSDAWNSLTRKIEKRYYDAGDWVTQKLRGTIVKLSEFRPLGVSIAVLITSIAAINNYDLQSNVTEEPPRRFFGDLWDSIKDAYNATEDWFVQTVKNIILIVMVSAFPTDEIRSKRDVMESMKNAWTEMVQTLSSASDAVVHVFKPTEKSTIDKMVDGVKSLGQ